ncbi:unnamed protein product [Gadus morhua 'NCC']
MEEKGIVAGGQPEAEGPLPLRCPLQEAGYGGYVALEMLKAAGPDQPVHCAAVQAPVIDWSMYGNTPSPVFPTE